MTSLDTVSTVATNMHPFSRHNLLVWPAALDLGYYV